MNGQLFKMWKQAPGVFSRFEDVLIPYVNQGDKVKAHTCLEKQKNKYWETYEVGDNKIWVKTRYKKAEDAREIINCKIIDEHFNEVLLVSDADKFRANAIHSFAATRIVLNMYLRALKRLNLAESSSDIWNNFRWKNGKEQLKIQIDFKERKSGYLRENDTKAEPAIHMGILASLIDIKKGDIKTKEFACRDFDRLAHEVGHAIFEAIRFDLRDREFLNEAFADLTAMFSLLSMMDICDRLVVNTEGDLRKPNFLRFLGESKPFDVTEIRDMANSRDVNINSSQPHISSRAISSAIYKCLLAVFELHQKPKEYDPSESLFRVARQLLDVFLYGILKLEKEKLTSRENFLPHLQAKMLEGVKEANISSDEEYLAKLSDIIRENVALKTDID